VGVIRLHWRGLAGGTEVWQELEAFFAGLRHESGAPADPAAGQEAASA